ncbi:MAG: VOC family protein [Patescibacteria group bacterium]
MKIKLNSVFVDDQDKALAFYTDILGFIKNKDVSLGEYRWLTVVSPEDPDGAELLLEPSENPDARIFKKALFEQGIPLTQFSVGDTRAEYERLKKLGVRFTMELTPMGPTVGAVFDVTCGNLIQIVQE